MSFNHGGKRHGAGRPPRATNARTREIADRAFEEGITPLEVMLDNMRFYHHKAEEALRVLLAGDLRAAEGDESNQGIIDGIKDVLELRKRAGDEQIVIDEKDGGLHVTPHRLTCRIIERQAPGIMKTQPNPSDREVLAGLVERVTYQNAENGFCVIRVKARSHRDLVTVVGHAAIISAGEWITASGDWVNDRTHGQQFRARFLKTSEPTSVEGIEKYLASGMIRGIGPAYAKKLLRAFGEKVFDVIETQADRLREVDGIGPVVRVGSSRPGPSRRRSARSWSSCTATGSARRGRCAALCGLPKHFGETHYRHGAGRDHIRQHLAGTDRRKLVDVANEQEGGLVRHGLHQRLHQQHIDHGGLIDNQQVTVERIVVAALEAAALRVDFEEPVDGLGLEAGRLGHALGRAASWSA